MNTTNILVYTVQKFSVIWWDAVPPPLCQALVDSMNWYFETGQSVMRATCTVGGFSA